MVVVVAHPGPRRAGEPAGSIRAYQLGVRECAQDVVDGLRRDRAQAGTDLGRQGVDVGVRVCAHLGQRGDPWTGDTQADFP
jgi:hypothetical protein